MDEQKRNRITWAFVILTVLTVALMLGNTLRRTTHIQLPATVPAAEDPTGETVHGDHPLTVVAVTPETVQSVIETLSRPVAYRRTVTVEQIWSGGSGTSKTSVVVLNGWTRTDFATAGGQTRHAITDEETTYIWYDDESAVYEAPAGDISADDEQHIPTYEDVLDLSVEEIAIADYGTYSGVNCIYVETAPDEAGYVLRYWISIDTGLLTAAEKLLDWEAVYRMVALSLDREAPAAKDFTLPDGRVLTSP